MIDMWAITPVLIKNSVCIMHLIIAPKIEFFYFFLTHCTKLTKNHENKFASSIKMFFPNTYKTVCVKAINLQWKYTYWFILTLSLSSWNCPAAASRRQRTSATRRRPVSLISETPRIAASPRIAVFAQHSTFFHACVILRMVRVCEVPNFRSTFQS